MSQLTLTRLSYSTLSKLDECPSRLFLNKGTSFKVTPGWAGVGGRACHSLLEAYDRDGSIWPMVRFEAEAAEIFSNEIASEEAASGVPSGAWRASKAGAEGRAWWSKRLPVFGDLYQTWRFEHPYLSDWVTPDGEEAIELEVSVNIPGVRLPFLAYVDKVMVDESRGNALVVIDHKSGSMLPSDLNQFHTYAALLEIRYGVRPEYAAIYDARRGALHAMRKGGPTVYPLHRIPTDVWIRGVQEREAIIELDLWPAKPSKTCNWCEVRDACTYGTAGQARRFDPHHPLYRGSVALAS